MKEPEDYDPRNLEGFRAIQNAGVDPTPLHAYVALQNIDALLRVACAEAKEIRYPLPGRA
jgi:hypothetical protein